MSSGSDEEMDVKPAPAMFLVPKAVVQDRTQKRNNKRRAVSDPQAALAAATAPGLDFENYQQQNGESFVEEEEEEEEFNNSIAMTSACPYASGGLMNGATDNDNVRKFHVLDETDDSDSEKSMSCDSDVPDEEIDQMLEDALRSKKRSADRAGLDKQPFEEKDKVVLIEKSQNHFDVLPEGWIQVTHNSGMPLYLHKTSRVCTLAKPYFLGPGSVRKHEVPLSAIPCLSYRRATNKERNNAEQQAQTRKHEVPLSAIPCLSYRRAMDKERKNAEQQAQTRTDTENTPRSSSSTPTPNGSTATAANQSELPNARIETVKENIESTNLKPDDVRAYAERLFKFKTIKVLRFKSWSERRQFTKKKKQEKQVQRPNLPAGTKLITFPIQNSDTDGAPSSTKKEWIMNPNGKSYVCILHEYVQHALKKQPTYKFTELENAATPYAATVSINDMQYGIGYGTSKKQAKSEAARATLEILIPEVRSKITTDAKTGSSASKEQDQDLSFFDEIRIEDPRVAEFCAKTTEPSPHDILLTCLQRNFGLNDLQISYQGNTLKNKKNQFTMTVGKHTATVVCKNKRDGKQRASQAILQALHPHISSWGSLLRLYGNGSVKSFKEKKLEEQEITLLQSKAAINSPNFAILDKLKLELSKLRDKRKAIKPIGLLMPSEDDSLPKLSSSNLKNVDL